MSNKIKELENEIARLKQQAEEIAEQERVAALEKWEPTAENVKKFVGENDLDEPLSDECSYGEYKDGVKFPNGWLGKNVHCEGGGEGDGEEYWIVFSLTKDNVIKYFRVDGWYQSYNGGELEWSNMFEAKPVQKTYTDYDKI